MFSARGVVVGGQQVARQGSLGFVNGGRKGVAWLGSGRKELVGFAFFENRFLVDCANADGLGGAGLDAGRGFADGQAVVAHVALADDAFGGAVTRDIVGTFEDAVLAADTLVVQVADDAGDRVFFKSEHGAADHAGGFDAMVAGGGDVLHEGLFGGAAGEESDAAPGFFFF